MDPKVWFTLKKATRQRETIIRLKDIANSDKMIETFVINSGMCGSMKIHVYRTTILERESLIPEHKRQPVQINNSIVKLYKKKQKRMCGE